MLDPTRGHIVADILALVQLYLCVDSERPVIDFGVDFLRNPNSTGLRIPNSTGLRIPAFSKDHTPCAWECQYCEFTSHQWDLIIKGDKHNIKRGDRELHCCINARVFGLRSGDSSTACGNHTDQDTVTPDWLLACGDWNAWTTQSADWPHRIAEAINTLRLAETRTRNETNYETFNWWVHRINKCLFPECYRLYGRFVL